MCGFVRVVSSLFLTAVLGHEEAFPVCSATLFTSKYVCVGLGKRHCMFSSALETNIKQATCEKTKWLAGHTKRHITFLESTYVYPTMLVPYMCN